MNSIYKILSWGQAEEPWADIIVEASPPRFIQWILLTRERDAAIQLAMKTVRSRAKKQHFTFHWTSAPVEFQSRTHVSNLARRFPHANKGLAANPCLKTEGRFAVNFERLYAVHTMNTCYWPREMSFPGNATRCSSQNYHNDILKKSYTNQA